MAASYPMPSNREQVLFDIDKQAKKCPPYSFLVLTLESKNTINIERHGVVRILYLIEKPCGSLHITFLIVYINSPRSERTRLRLQNLVQL
jgi:hypothetical protein